MPAAPGMKLKHREPEGAGPGPQRKGNWKRALVDRVQREEEVIK